MMRDPRCTLLLLGCLLLGVSAAPKPTYSDIVPLRPSFGLHPGLVLGRWAKSVNSTQSPSMQDPSTALPPLQPTPPPTLQAPLPTPAPVVRGAISIVAPVASAVLVTLSDSADTIIIPAILEDENQSTGITFGSPTTVPATAAEETEPSRLVGGSAIVTVCPASGAVATMPAPTAVVAATTATESKLTVESSTLTTVPGSETAGTPAKSTTPTADSKPVFTEYGTTLSITTLSESGAVGVRAGSRASATASKLETSDVPAESENSAATSEPGDTGTRIVPRTSISTLKIYVPTEPKTPTITSNPKATDTPTSTTISEPKITGVRTESETSTSTLKSGIPVESGGLTTALGLEVVGASKIPTNTLRCDIPVESETSTTISEPRSTGIPAESKTLTTTSRLDIPVKSETSTTTSTSEATGTFTESGASATLGSKTGILTEYGTTTTTEVTTIPTEPAISTTTSATVDPSMQPQPASAGIYATTTTSVPAPVSTSQPRLSDVPALAPTDTTTTTTTTAATFQEIGLATTAPADGNSIAGSSTLSRAGRSSTTLTGLPTVTPIETAPPALIPESTNPVWPLLPLPIAPESAIARLTALTTFLTTTITAPPKTPLPTPPPTTPTPIAIVIPITRASAIPASAEVTAGTSVDEDGNQTEILAFYDATSGETFGADRGTVFDSGAAGVSVPVWTIFAVLGGKLLLL